MVSRIGGAAVVCPFVLMVGPASWFLRFTAYCDENCRSRSTSGWNVPAIANVRAAFSERKENLERLNKFAAAIGRRDFCTSLFRTRHGNKPRTKVASATR